MKRSIIWIIAMLFCAMFWAAVLYPFIAHAQPAPGPVIDRADQVSTDTSSFNNNLSSSDNTVQKALDTIDNMSVSGGGSSTLDGLTDVAISSASSAQLLINDGAGQFRNRTLSGAVSIGTTGVASITGYVPTTTTVNGQALSSDVTITPTTLNLLIGTNTQAYDADLDYLSGFTPAANIKSILNAADYSSVRSLLGLVIGTNVQAYDADLTTYAGIAPSANIQTFLGSADNSAARTNLGLGSLATQSGTFSGTSSGTNTGDQTNISGNAGTATALAADPTACGAGDFVNDIAANGTLTCGTPSGGGVGIGTINPGATNAIMKYVASTTGDDSSSMFDVSGNIGIGTTAPLGGFVVMNGNVGIGTWSPTNKLQVVGTVAATAFTGNGSGLTGIAAGGWTDGGTNVFTTTTTDNVGIGTTTPKTGFSLDVRGSQYVSGNVGIGTVTVPGVPLYVAGPIKTSEIQGTSAPGTPFTITQANIGIGTAAAGAAVVIGNSPSHTSVGLCIGTGGCVGYCTGALGTCSACTCLTTQ